MPSDVEPFVVRVDGYAEIPRPAERALIDVVITSSGKNKAAVSEEVITTAKHVENLLRELSPADESAEAKDAAALAHWAKTTLSSTSHVPYNKDGQPEARQYQASINFDIRFKDFKALGGFGSRLSALSHVEVRNIRWALTTATERSFKSQLRKEATRDALEKVKDYCEVMNCRNLRPVELTEDQSTAYSSRENGRPRRGARSTVAGVYTHGSSAPGLEAISDERDESPLEFKPEVVKMGLNVSVTFHAE